MTTAILGAGMAGFGAAHAFHREGVDCVVFDKHAYHGGHSASFRHGDFVFDDGPHISFTKSERMQQLFGDSVNQEYETFKVSVNNYWKGHWIKHPAQCNLHGLPEDLVVACLTELIDAYQREPGAIKTYADWLVANYGRTFAETFPMEYGRKYHTAPADAMSTDWVGPRLYKPSIEEVIRGALTAATTDVHYVTTARYPTRDGFVSYLKGFVPHTNLRLGHDVVSIDHVARVLQFADGSSHGYDRLVSSFPLPELVRRMASAPREVVDAASRLACTTCVVVNIGVNRDDISENHWSYFYDQDYVFTRVSFPHMFSRHNVPANAGSIQAELYFSAKYRPLAEPPEAFIQPVIQDLIRCGLLREQDDVLYTGASVVPYANVIFDLERSEAVATVHGYLDELGIAYCGRYGEWGYHWTDEAFMSGERAARTILEEGGKPRS